MINENYKQNATIISLLLDQAETTPDKTALCFLKNGESLEYSITYGELVEKVKTIGSYLLSLNLEGGRVLLLYPSGIDFVASFFGCLLAKVIAIPAYPPRSNQKSEMVNSIIVDAKPKAILTVSNYLTKFSNIFSELNNQPITTDALPVNIEKRQSYPVLDGKHIAFLQYTSGSTGKPKGVIVTHQNIMHNQKLIKYKFGHNDETIFASWLPMYHDMGLVGNLMQPIYLGVKCVLMSPESFLQKPYRWLKAISDYKVTTTGAPNFAYELCANAAISDQEMAEIDLSCLRVLYNGAEPIRAETLDKFAKRFVTCGFNSKTFYPCYGMAEATLLVSGGEHSGQPIVKSFDKEKLKEGCAVHTKGNGIDLVSCGQTDHGQKVEIVDPQTNETCPTLQVGEIWLKGGSIVDGYFNKNKKYPGDYFGCLRGQPGIGTFLRTGDMGFLDEKGDLFVTGRIKDLIIIRGRNYYPQDLEHAIAMNNPIFQNDATVACSLTSENENRLCVVQEIARSHYKSFDKKKAFEFVRRILAEEFGLSVSMIKFVRPYSIPKTSSGKLQRTRCKEMVLDGSIPVLAEWVSNFEASGCSVEKANSSPNQIGRAHISLKDIQKLIVELIGLDTSNVDMSIVTSSFMDLGLDSLKSVILISDIETAFGCKLSPTIVFDYPNVAQLSEYIFAVKNGSSNP